MPTYLITDPESGRKVRLTGDSPPTEEEINAVFAQAPAKRERPSWITPVPFETPQRTRSGTGGVFFPQGKGQQDPEMQGFDRGAGTAAIEGVRYGAPVAAAMIAGPQAGFLTLSALGGIGGVLGETFAEATEVGRGDREKMSGKEIAGAGVLGATPFVRGGGALVRAAVNAPAAVGTLALANTITGNETTLGQAGFAGTISGVLSFLGGRAGLYRERAERGAAAVAEAQGMAAPVVAYAPDLANVEAGAVARGNKAAVKTLTDRTTMLAQNIDAVFPRVDAMSDLGAELANKKNLLNNLGKQADKAAAVAAKTTEDLSNHIQNLSFEGKTPAMNVVANAKRKTLEAVSAQYVSDKAVGILIGGPPPLSDVAQGLRMKNIKAAGEAANEVISGNLKELYAKTGVNLNTNVIGRVDVQSAIKQMSRKGGALFGKDARGAVKAMLLKEIDKNGFITQERFGELKQKIARGLTPEGELVSTASQRIAAKIYTSLNRYSDRFMKNAMGDQAKDFITARAAAAENFKSRDADAIQDIFSGNSEKVVKRLTTEGPGAYFDEINRYKKTIANTFDAANPESAGKASDAAASFEQDVFGAIRSNIIDQSLIRGSGVSGAKAINPQALAKTLDKITSRGFPIESLNMGAKKDIEALARLATERGDGGFSVKEISDYISNVRELGGDTALARAAYVKEMRKAALGGGVASMRRETQRLKELQRKAKLSDTEASAALAAAKADDLVVFMNDTSMGASRDAANNAKWGFKLLATGPKKVKDLVSVMETSGQIGKLNTLRQGVTSDVMQDFIIATPGGARALSTEAINSFFFSPVMKSEREAFKNLVGPERWNNLTELFANKVKRIFNDETLVGGGRTVPGELANMARARVSAGNVVAYSSVDRLLQLWQSGHYNVAYYTLVDPTWAPRFKRANYSIDEFAARSPVNALALRLWSEQDERTQGQKANGGQ